MAEADRDSAGGGEWMSISSAAWRLGVTPSSIRAQIARGTLSWRPEGSHGRSVLVPPDDALADAKKVPVADPEMLPHTDIWDIEVLREELQEAHLAIAVAVAERYAADEIRKAEVGALRELADRLTAELAEARRPWWRRLLNR